jgi:hypothetical protein
MTVIHFYLVTKYSPPAFAGEWLDRGRKEKDAMLSCFLGLQFFWKKSPLKA